MLSPADYELTCRDRALPGLATILDPDAFLASLRRAVHGISIDTARSTYVRYKPGMNCLVAYRLTVDGVEIDAYAKAHRPDAHEQFQKALEKPGVAGPLGPGRIILRDKAITVSVFPNDGEIKALHRLDETEKRERLLRRVFTHRPQYSEGELQGIRYKPERRYVAQVVSPSGPQAVLKIYTNSGFNEAYGNTNSLLPGEVLRIPRTLGHSNKHRILAFEWMEGDLLSDVLADPALDVSKVEKVGVALAEVHIQQSSELSNLSREAEASSLISVSAGLEFLCPQIGSRTNSLARRLASHLLSRPALGFPVHGDFYAKQVLLAGDHVVILDFDSAVAGDPAADLGLFIAHLERGALRGSLPTSHVEPVRDALLRGYASATRLPVAERVGLYTAIGLLRLAPHPFRNRHRDWPHDVEATIACAEQIYRDTAHTATYGGSALSAAARRVDGQDEGSAVPGCTVSDPFGVTADPAMPFLAQALNPLDVHIQFRRRLRHLTGPEESLDVIAIRVVRHKKGRRALVEYDVRIGKPGAPHELVTFVGKARARGLDQRSYETVAALWAAGLNDENADGISVPRPVGVVPEFQMWLHRKVAGVPATDLLAGPDGIALARRIAEAARKIHTSGVRATSRHTMQDELRILHEKLPLVAESHPEWGLRIQKLLAACDRVGSRVMEPTRCGIHRDYYADQVLVDGTRLHLLDFDLYCEGDPGVDIGNFLGHMQEWSLRTFNVPGALALQEEALEERFIELSGERTRQAVRAYTALTLARHVYLSTQFPDRRQFTEAIMELCEEKLWSALEFIAGARPQLPALPSGVRG